MQRLRNRGWLSVVALVAFLFGLMLPRLEESLQPVSLPAPSPTTADSRSTPTKAPPVARNGQLPVGTPGSVGIDSRTLSRIDDFMAQRVASGEFPGGVVLVARHGVVVKHTSYGDAVDYDEEGQRLPMPIPTRKDTIYDLASLTKLFTITAALTLVDQGRLDLDAPVARYLPEFAANGKEEVTIRQLMTHTSGLPAGLALSSRGDTTEERLRSAYEVELQSEPGEKYLYSDAGPIFLGKVIERITGVGLDQYLRESVLEPLGLADTMYRPPKSLRPRIAATEVRRSPEKVEEESDGPEEQPKPASRPALIWGEVHDPEAWALDGVAGNAGLFSTAEDVAILGQMMLQGGSYAGARVLKLETAAAALRPQIPGSDEQGLGWELDQDWYMGALATSHSFGHTGFTGTALVVDPDDQLVIVVLTNRLHSLAIQTTNAARVGVADIVFAALRD